jgi:hypothetical protein
MSGISIERAEGTAWRHQLDAMVKTLGPVIEGSTDYSALRLYNLLSQARVVAWEIETRPTPTRRGVDLVKH